MRESSTYSDCEGCYISIGCNTYTVQYFIFLYPNPSPEEVWTIKWFKLLRILSFS